MSDVTQTYVDWLRDPEVNQYLETRHTEQTLASVGDFVRAMIASPDQHLFAICVDGKHVGNIKVGPVRQYHRLADVSLFIGDRAVWGQGVATVAIKLISRFALRTLGLKKLNAGVYGPNLGSAAAFRRAGYSQEGLRRRHYRLGDDMADAFEFGLCAEDLGAEDLNKEGAAP